MAGKEIILGAEYWGGCAQKVRVDKHIGLAVDEDDYSDVETVQTIFEACMEKLGEVLNEMKSADGDVSISIADFITLKASYRPGTDGSNGNWGIGITAGSELKKRIKDDAELEELSEDDE